MRRWPNEQLTKVSSNLRRLLHSRNIVAHQTSSRYSSVSEQVKSAGENVQSLNTKHCVDSPLCTLQLSNKDLTSRVACPEPNRHNNVTVCTQGIYIRYVQEVCTGCWIPGMIGSLNTQYCANQDYIALLYYILLDNNGEVGVQRMTGGWKRVETYK